MSSESSESHRVRQRPQAALTPRPLHLLLIGRAKPGAEPTLREVQARFPLDAAAEAGIDAVEAFIGSGHYAVQLEIDHRDVQQVLATFLNDHRVRAFRDELEPVTEGLPGPDYRFGPWTQRGRPDDLPHGRPPFRCRHVPVAGGTEHSGRRCAAGRAGRTSS